MSTLSATNLKHASSGSNNIVLNSDGTVGGSCIASTAEVNGTHTTGTITSGTDSLTVASAAGIATGMSVVGEGITPGTTVSEVDGTTITLSANANATLSTDPVAFYINNKLLTPALVGGQLCRAWVNFNGTGTVAIRASYNVSSITDNGTGDYTVNFTSALADANYSAIATSTNTGTGFGAYAVGYEDVRARSASSWSFWTGSSSALQDTAFTNVAIFR